MPRVTVAICTYNRATTGYLQEAIQSALAQTYNDMKVVVYDNGSTDDTENIVRYYEQFGVDYVKFSANRRDAFNAILDCCETEYLVIFHDDDTMLQHMIETEVKKLDEHPNAIIVGQGTLSSLPASKDKIFRKNELIKFSTQGGISVFCCPSVMFRMSRLNELSLRFDTNSGGAGDWLMWLKINTFDNEMIVLSKPIMKYRIHTGSDSAGHSNNDKWNDTHFYVETWLRENNLCSDYRALHSYFLGSGVSGYAKAALDGTLNLADVEKKLDAMKEKYGWELYDWDRLYMGLLAQIVLAIAKRQAPVSMYTTWRDKIAKHFGHKISFKRNLKYFLKYVIWERLGLSRNFGSKHFSRA